MGRKPLGNDGVKNGSEKLWIVLNGFLNCSLPLITTQNHSKPLRTTQTPLQYEDLLREFDDKHTADCRRVFRTAHRGYRWECTTGSRLIGDVLGNRKDSGGYQGRQEHQASEGWPQHYRWSWDNWSIFWMIIWTFDYIFSMALWCSGYHRALLFDDNPFSNDDKYRAIL